ncbi:hypothetical protein CKO31_05345 [Thiohalocapsa halophila]|uniref:PEP-CTERM sorting domain-containing protein n=1 Tax=Thiohalocapsa halophila TaxID=69359 RepID=A0ABS1CFL4_9GAMM|nr:PEP-CTERM sorting domain-containing protein [Thiohalocapsa halophila]MBK1630176.1 hypothetical protein [Thiohalocapsa halophila]
METKQLTLAAYLCAGAAAPGLAGAADIGLFEWAFNVDGTVYGNGFTTPDAITDVPGLDSTSFDETTGLGRLVYQNSTIGDHFFGGYFDLEIDVADNGFSNENGSTAGAAAAGQSWEMDEPFNGDIFTNFQANTLDNTSSVDTTSFPIGTDVAMATIYAYSLLDNQVATITIDIAESLNTSGLALIQTDFGSGGTVELAADLDIRTQGVPAPATLVLLAFGLFGLHRTAAQRRA